MNLTDIVQILILLLLLMLLLKPFYSHWLPEKWRLLILRCTPARTLKYEGIWRRHSAKPDK